MDSPPRVGHEPSMNFPGKIIFSLCQRTPQQINHKAYECKVASADCKNMIIMLAIMHTLVFGGTWRAGWMTTAKLSFVPYSPLFTSSSNKCFLSTEKKVTLLLALFCLQSNADQCIICRVCTVFSQFNTSGIHWRLDLVDLALIWTWCLIWTLW